MDNYVAAVIITYFLLSIQSYRQPSPDCVINVCMCVVCAGAVSKVLVHGLLSNCAVIRFIKSQPITLNKSERKERARRSSLVDVKTEKPHQQNVLMLKHSLTDPHAFTHVQQ